MNFQGKRYWLIGASEGLGRALALEMSKAGAELVLSARNAERLAALAAELAGKAEVLAVDAGSRASVEEAAAKIGAIDGMVYLAALYWPMAAKAIDAEKAEAMADINFTGAVRAVAAVLPGMIARGAGHVVLTGSLSAYRGLPRAMAYGGSKAALLYMAESLRADLAGTGVRVQIAQPGFIRTRLTDMNEFRMPFLMEPEAAAREMMTLMQSRAFKRDFPRAFGLMFRIGQFLPGWLYYRLFR